MHDLVFIFVRGIITNASHNSITTELYCYVLDTINSNNYTPNACLYSKYTKAPIISQQGSLDNVPYKLIIREVTLLNCSNSSPVIVFVSYPTR